MSASQAPHSHTNDEVLHGHSFVPGDLVFVVLSVHGAETQWGGVVVELDDGLLTLVLPHGVELINLRAASCARAWRVEHAPRELSPSEALDYGAERLRALRARPLVVVHPDDEREASG